MTLVSSHHPREAIKSAAETCGQGNQSTVVYTKIPRTHTNISLLLHVAVNFIRYGQSRSSNRKENKSTLSSIARAPVRSQSNSGIEMPPPLLVQAAVKAYKLGAQAVRRLRDNSPVVSPISGGNLQKGSKV
jgi:hypothetical protein